MFGTDVSSSSAGRARRGTPTMATASILLLLLLGCSDSTTELEGQAVSFTTVTRASYSGIDDPRYEVVRDDDRWAAVWSELNAGLSPSPARPEVDFDHRMVVVAGLGERPNGCYQVEIETIRAGQGGLAVAVVESEPGASCICTQAITHPVHVVELDRRTAATRFDVSRRTVSCG